MSLALMNLRNRSTACRDQSRLRTCEVQLKAAGLERRSRYSYSASLRRIKPSRIDHEALHVRAVRGGQEVTVLVAELVPGDVVNLRAGIWCRRMDDFWLPATSSLTRRC